MKTTVTLIAALLAGCACATAAETIEYTGEVTAQASSEHFAPYMLGSWNSGRNTAGRGIWQNGHLERALDADRRFSWSYGLEYSLGYANAFGYNRYTSSGWSEEYWRTSSARLIQLFGEVKYRAVYLLAGMKERESGIVDGTLSAGDLVRSNNARPIPGVAAGFLHFVDIPFTNGWVQIDGEIMYGRFTDNGFNSSQFNRYQGLYTQDLCYTYKRCYFRTKPSQPLSVTVGMQTAGEFGGSTYRYTKGAALPPEHRGFRLRDVWDMFFPREGSGEGYYKGNSLGSWDFKARLNLRNGSALSVYFEWPWEDGSGIGRRNGWDGLWGVQYDFAQGSPVESVVFEYLDFTNHGGPVHFAPGDAPGTTITSAATGGDNYYNNDFYGAYANYGMAIGTPFLLAPVYNTDGYGAFAHNVARGFHAAAKGTYGQWQWRAMLSYQKAAGESRRPSVRKLHDTSAMLEAAWHPVDALPGLKLKATVAFDCGNLRGNNAGGAVTISYSGLFTIGKK